MNIYTNYSIGEILRKAEQGNLSAEQVWLKEQIGCYERKIRQRIIDATEQLHREAPEEPMRWIAKNVEKDIQHYVRCEALGKQYNVLMTSPNQWKHIADIGIPITQPEPKNIDYGEWISAWKENAEEFGALHTPVYETHAHYNLAQFRPILGQLIPLLQTAGIKRCIIPAVEFRTCAQIKELFDDPQYDWICYAFGSHPKYLWKENWTEKTWAQLNAFAQDPKCAAIGEAGLDYSYNGFDDMHRQNQQIFFRRFIETANQNGLPLILHIRPADPKSACEYDATEDALKILKEHPPKYGAVVHCFGGNSEEMRRFIQVGASCFGIGGRICYGNHALEQAVRDMPEESVLLETDAPFMRLNSERMPNTSLSLLQVAKKIAVLRETTVERILRITYENAGRLLGN